MGVRRGLRSSRSAIVATRGDALTQCYLAGLELVVSAGVVLNGRLAAGGNVNRYFLTPPLRVSNFIKGVLTSSADISLQSAIWCVAEGDMDAAISDTGTRLVSRVRDKAVVPVYPVTAEVRDFACTQAIAAWKGN